MTRKLAPSHSTSQRNDVKPIGVCMEVLRFCHSTSSRWGILFRISDDSSCLVATTATELTNCFTSAVGMCEIAYPERRFCYLPSSNVTGIRCPQYRGARNKRRTKVISRICSSRSKCAPVGLAVLAPNLLERREKDNAVWEPYNASCLVFTSGDTWTTAAIRSRESESPTWNKLT
jgi:hypothetical protein